MKAFLWNDYKFFEVNKKEEIDNNTYIISDYEYDMIKETLDYAGYLWTEAGEIKWSGKRPDEVMVWDSVSHTWVVDSILFEARLESRQIKVWDEIKDKRLLEITNGVRISSIDKVFHTDNLSIIQYSTIAGMVALGTYETTPWKVMDNSWVMLTVEILKELQTAMSVKTNENYKIAEQHKAAMLLVDNPLEYDYSTGWV